jgi:hypothetical protein
LVIRTLDPDWIWIGIQPKMLDPDPDQMNTDPKTANNAVKLNEWNAGKEIMNE